MSHTSEKRWEGVSNKITSVATDLVTVLNNAEEQYNQLLEVYDYVGNDVTALAELLFKEEIAALPSPDTGVVTQEMIDRCSDIINTMQSAHQLYQAATNVAITQADRMTDLRRMI